MTMQTFNIREQPSSKFLNQCFVDLPWHEVNAVALALKPWFAVVMLTDALVQQWTWLEIPELF
jgi:hypothetical protein